MEIRNILILLTIVFVMGVTCGYFSGDDIIVLHRHETVYDTVALYGDTLYDTVPLLGDVYENPEIHIISNCDIEAKDGLKFIWDDSSYAGKTEVRIIGGHYTMYAGGDSANSLVEMIRKGGE